MQSRIEFLRKEIEALEWLLSGMPPMTEKIPEGVEEILYLALQARRYG